MTSGDAKKALDASGKELEGRKLEVRYASDPRPQRGEESFGPRKSKGNTVFVGSLSYKSTKDSLEEFFEDCGKIKEVRIGKDFDGKPKGFAHIEFEDEEGVKKAIELSGKELDGRSIKVDFADNKRGGGSGRHDRERHSGHSHHDYHSDRPERFDFERKHRRYDD